METEKEIRGRIDEAKESFCLRGDVVIGWREDNTVEFEIAAPRTRTQEKRDPAPVRSVSHIRYKSPRWCLLNRSHRRRTSPSYDGGIAEQGHE